MSSTRRDEGARGPAGPRVMARALAALSGAQQALLREISRHPEPVTISELSERMSLHPNSVRDSMNVLVEAGLVARRRRPGRGRGRPSWAYESVAPTGPAALSREFADLGAAMADHLAAHAEDASAAAYDIGLRWGRLMAGQIPPPVSASDVEGGSFRQAQRAPEQEPGAPGQSLDVYAGQVRLLLASLGYRPRADDEPTRIRLYQCPLRGEGRAVNPLVCQMHRGMLDQVLAAASDRGVGQILTPFAGPDYCLVELRDAGDAASRP